MTGNSMIQRLDRFNSKIEQRCPRSRQKQHAAGFPTVTIDLVNLGEYLAAGTTNCHRILIGRILRQIAKSQHQSNSKVAPGSPTALTIVPGLMGPSDRSTASSEVGSSTSTGRPARNTTDPSCTSKVRPWIVRGGPTTVAINPHRLARVESCAP